MRVDVEAMRRENAALHAQIADLLATNAQLVAELAKLNERVAELLAIAQRKQRKPPALKTPEAPPALDPEARAAFDARPAPPELPDKTKDPKRSPRRTGRNAVPDHLESEEHRLRPASCDHCGSTALDVVDEVREEKLHVVKEH